MTKDHPRTISPREAARRTGLGRSTIMRALSSHELKAMRDNKNQWQIDPDDLEAWQVARSGPARTVTTDHQEPAQMDHVDHLVKIAALEAERDGLVARLASAEADRDAWQRQAEKLAEKGRGWRWPWQ